MIIAFFDHDDTGHVATECDRIRQCKTCHDMSRLLFCGCTYAVGNIHNRARHSRHFATCRDIFRQCETEYDMSRRQPTKTDGHDKNTKNCDFTGSSCYSHQSMEAHTIFVWEHQLWRPFSISVSTKKMRERCHVEIVGHPSK